VDAKISTQNVFEGSHGSQSQKNVCSSTPASTVDTQTFNTTPLVDNCHEKLGYAPGQLIKYGSLVVSPLQKEVNQISDGRDGNVTVGTANSTNIVNESVQNAEVILLDANLTLLNDNMSFPPNVATSSNCVTNPLPLTTQLPAPLVVTSQPSVSTATANQVMAVTIPGTTDFIQQAAAFSGIPLYPPCEQAAPCSLAMTNSSPVVAITIPGPQNVNPLVHDQTSTVIMCGSDGIVPQFIAVPHQEPCKYAAWLCWTVCS
jgi:hypothetical protein